MEGQVRGGQVILVIAPTCDLDTFHLGINGVRTKRANVLIGNHQLIGATQIQSVNDPNGDHQVLGSHHSHN